MVTGEVPTGAGEAEGGVGESAEGGGRGGEEIPRGGVCVIYRCFSVYIKNSIIIDFNHNVYFFI